MALTVLQIVPSMEVGGVETGTLDLAKALVAKGHRALVISSGGALVAQLEAAGAIHYTLPVHRKVPWTIWEMAARVAEVVESHGVEVIHARSRVPAIIGFLACRRVGAKISFRLGDRQRIPCFITTAHGFYSTHLASRVMGWGRVVIAISEQVARHMIDRFQVPPERVRMIPRGVDLNLFPYRPPDPKTPKGAWRVGVVGRITPLKGHRELIKAWSIVVKSFPKAQLQIAGGASADHQRTLRELEALVSRLGLEEGVKFLGHQSDIPKLMTQLDLVTLPSTGQEAFGRVLIEAQAAGVPVVATQVGGVAEVVVDRKTGLLVPPADPMALGSAIVTLLKDRSLAAEFSKAGRRRVESLYPVGRMVDQTLEVYRQASERMRILVIKFSAIGDVVLVTPSLRALRERFPKAHLTVLVGKESRELLNRCPYLDELIVFDRRRDGSPLGLLRLARKLRQHQVDLVVDFQNNRVSHWLGFLSGAVQRFGVAGRRFSFLLTHPVQHPQAATPPVEHQFRLLRILGIEKASDQLELWPGPSDEERIEAFLKESWVGQEQPLIVVHPGGATQWPSKRWALSRYAELVDRIAQEAHGRVVLTGSPSEIPLAEEIYRATRTKPILAVGKTSLNELAALIRRAHCFVGSDSAALHVAAAVGTPCVALFGSTDPLAHAPPMSRIKILKAKIPCSPCYHRVCYRRGAGYMECMRIISVDQVAEAVAAHLKKGNVIASPPSPVRPELAEGLGTGSGAKQSRSGIASSALQASSQ